MYGAYEPQKQICAAPNGPSGQDHGFVLFDIFLRILFSTYIIYLFRSCQGDSGGGLLYSKNGRWYVAGIASYATGCGRQAFPTVFTKTSAYIDWIRTMVNRPILT
jgi:hypothetical protein